VLDKSYEDRLEKLGRIRSFDVDLLCGSVERGQITPSIVYEHRHFDAEALNAYIALMKMTLLGQTVTVMGRRQVLVGADWDDTGRIDVVMRDVVVPLDMVEIHGLGNTGGLVEVL
jgi:hypothetical protein